MFLFPRVISQLIPANSVATTIDDENNKTVSLSFDFLDKGQGAVLVLLHTGMSSNDVELHGIIKGGKKIVRIFVKPRERVRYVFLLLIGVVFGFFLVIMEQWFGLRYSKPLVLALFIFGYFLTDILSRTKTIPSSLKAFVDPFSKSEFA